MHDLPLGTAVRRAALDVIWAPSRLAAPPSWLSHRSPSRRPAPSHTRSESGISVRFGPGPARRPRLGHRRRRRAAGPSVL